MTSRFVHSQLTFKEIDFRIISKMPVNSVAFLDEIEENAVAFNLETEIIVWITDRKGEFVV